MLKIKIDKDSVTFVAINEFTKETNSITIKERYAILPKTRWNILYNYMSLYFVKNGRKGCYIGERKDREGNIFEIWDLTKVFNVTDVTFIENDEEVLKLMYV